MTSFNDNYLIARKLSDEILSRITTTHHIIPTNTLDLLPAHVVFNPMTTTHINGVSIAVVQALMDYHIKIKAIRHHVQMSAVHFKEIKARTTALLLAVGYLGVGQCGELSMQIVIELIKSGRSDCSSLLIKNGTTNNHSEDHLIVLFGKGHDSFRLSDNAGNLKETLRILPSECLAIDLLLNHIGPANLLLEQQAQYYTKNKMDTIISETSAKTLTPADALLLEENAKNIARHVMRSSPITTITKTAFARHDYGAYLFHLPTSLKQYGSADIDAVEDATYSIHLKPR